MKSFLKWLVLAPILVVVLVFAVVNRHEVTVSFDPFGSASSGLSLTMPLFLALFLAAMVGVLLGGAATWFEQGRHRRLARDSRAELARLRAEGDRFRLQPPLVAHSEDRTAA